MNLLSPFGPIKDITKLVIKVTGIGPQGNLKIARLLKKHGILSFQKNFKSPKNQVSILSVVQKEF